MPGLSLDRQQLAFSRGRFRDELFVDPWYSEAVLPLKDAACGAVGKHGSVPRRGEQFAVESGLLRSAAICRLRDRYEPRGDRKIVLPDRSCRNGLISSVLPVRSYRDAIHVEPRTLRVVRCETAKNCS